LKCLKYVNYLVSAKKLKDKNGLFFYNISN